MHSEIIQLKTGIFGFFFSKHWEGLARVYGFMLFLHPPRAQIQGLSRDHNRQQWNIRNSVRYHYKKFSSERKNKRINFHDYNYNMNLPHRLLMQAALASADLRASHSSCPAAKRLADSFCNTSLQHPSFLETDICGPTTEKQKKEAPQRFQFSNSVIFHFQQIQKTLKKLNF